MSQQIGLTGVTGALGGAVTRHLSATKPVLIARNPARAPQLPGCQVRQGSYHRDARRALEGIDVLFMISAAEAADRRSQHREFIAAAAAAGVRHLVYTSFDGASPQATFTLGRDHADAEEAIRASGMDFTFLRDNFYADILPLFADRDGVIRGPAGDGRVAAVARADVAAVAATVLQHPDQYAGATLTLTGPEALTLTEVAARAGAVLGRDLRFEDETVEEAYTSRRAAYNAEDWQLDAWVSTYTAIADGSVSRVTNDVEQVLGRPAHTLEEALQPSVGG